MIKSPEEFTTDCTLVLANMMHDGRKDLIDKWSPVVEALNDENYVMAVIIAEMTEGIPDDFIERMRKVYDVRKTS